MGTEGALNLRGIYPAVIKAQQIMFPLKRNARNMKPAAHQEGRGRDRQLENPMLGEHQRGIPSHVRHSGESYRQLDNISR